VVTRFPPEPNGYLHIGHAKSICLNFGIARDYGGPLPSPDGTTPTRPRRSRNTSSRFKEDVRWLGFEWGAHSYHAADYFDQLYDWAEKLVREARRSSTTRARRTCGGREAH